MWHSLARAGSPELSREKAFNPFIELNQTARTILALRRAALHSTWQAGCLTFNLMEVLSEQRHIKSRSM
jgi:hypothetical protein